MSVTKPPLPPRRRVPPLPPPSTSDEVVEELKRNSIATRIAQLKLDQVNHVVVPQPKKLRESEPVANANGLAQPRPFGPTGGHERRARQPPPIPPKWTRPSSEQLARALARPPPPPPAKKSPVAQAQIQRPHHPRPARLPTPPPDPETLHEPVNKALLDVQDSESSLCLECRDFSHVDAHATQFPRHTVSSLVNLAYDLTEPFPYELEKARAIFTWLHHNIAYDTESFFSGDIQASTPESTLMSGLAVCDGYAGLFKHLAETVGMQVHKVTGHGKGVGYQATDPGQPVPPYSSGHAWNCAFLDNEWRLIDACWGAGALEGSTYHKRFAPMWFTSTPAEFIRSHFPEDSTYQLLNVEGGGVISWEDYIMDPARPIIYGDFYQLDLWPNAIQPPFRYIAGNKRMNFQVRKRCEHMSIAEADNFVFMVSFGNERVPLELDNQGGWSADVFIPSGARDVSLFYVRTVNGEEAKGFGIQNLRNALGRQAMTFGGLAKWILI